MESTRFAFATIIPLVLSLASTSCSRSAPAGGVLAAEAARAQGHVIAGRIVDPQRLMPNDADLMIWSEEDSGSVNGQPVPLRRDGTFVTHPLPPGTYVLEVRRTPHSSTAPATPIGLSIITLGSADISGATVAIRSDTALEGTFRMRSDDRAAAWPASIVVLAPLAIEGLSLGMSSPAEGAPGGKFVLRNAFGPRVLRSGYTLSPGESWWPAEVLLDGQDITNVPTDFSTKTNSRLEVIFTKHPARFAGTVTDNEYRPVSNAWVVVFSADRAQWHPWSSMSQVVQAGANGSFRFTSAPGGYLARALPPTAFRSARDARFDYERLAQGATPITLGDRELKTLALTVNDR